MRVLPVLALCLVTLPAAAADMPGHVMPKTDDEIIANAMSAAPRAVAENAAIMAMDDKGQMRELRPAKGGSPFTCMPDNPMSPGNDPMCLDKNAMAWVQAWMTKQAPPEGMIGFAYMLAGGSDASNADPYATAPKSTEKWIDTGPHVMVLNAPSMLRGYPTQAGDPTQPYVMWPNTPYAHLMIPVGEMPQATAEMPMMGR